MNKPTWELTLKIFYSFLWRTILFYAAPIIFIITPLAFVLGAMGYADNMQLWGEVYGGTIVIPCMIVALRGALAVHTPSLINGALVAAPK